MPVIPITNNRLDWYLLYKPFNGNFLPAIKVIKYCIMPRISHLHIFIFVLATTSILSSLVCFPIINIFIYNHFFTSNSLFNILFYMSTWYLGLFLRSKSLKIVTFILWNLKSMWQPCYVVRKILIRMKLHRGKGKSIFQFKSRFFNIRTCERLYQFLSVITKCKCKLKEPKNRACVTPFAKHLWLMIKFFIK